MKRNDKRRWVRLNDSIESIRQGLDEILDAICAPEAKVLLRGVEICTECPRGSGISIESPLLSERGITFPLEPFPPFSGDVLRF